MNKFSWQLIHIFEKGVKAFFAGKAYKDCPYHGRIGFNGQRADYWRQGFNAAKSGASTEPPPRGGGNPFEAELI